MTDAVLIRETDREPAWIERPYMARAEGYGERLDRMLSRVALAVMSRNGFDDKSRFTGFFDRHFNQKWAKGDFGLNGFEFRTRSGEMIREPEFQKMMDDPEKYLEP